LQDVEAALKDPLQNGGVASSGDSIFSAESFTFVCTSGGRFRSSNPNPKPAPGDPLNCVTRLPSLLQLFISSMLAGEYCVFKVSSGADKDWDAAMQEVGLISSCYFVQLAVLHFQRKITCSDKSAAAITITRHSNVRSFSGASTSAELPALVNIADGSVVTVSYAARGSCSSCRWIDVCKSRDITVGSVDLPLGLDAAVRSMQVAELCDVHCSSEDAYALEPPAGGVPVGVDASSDILFRSVVLCFSPNSAPYSPFDQGVRRKSCE
jgi:hypothetical protein